MRTGYLRRLGGRSMLAAGLVLTAPVGAQCVSGWLPGEGVAGVAGGVTAVIRWDADGPGPESPALIAGGRFTVAGNVDASHVASWDGAAWSRVGEGMTEPSDFEVLPSGDLVASRWFALGEVPGGVVRWDGVAWAPLGSGPERFVNALVATPSGELVAGGAFTSVGGVNVNRVARWNGAAWSAMGDGFAGEDGSEVHDLAVLRDGRVVAAVKTVVAGVSSPGVFGWDGKAWSQLGSMDATVSTLAVLSSGDLLAGGRFTSVNGVSANRIARWGGSTWSAFGAGLEGGSSGRSVDAIAELPDGRIIATGDFTSAGGMPIADAAVWDGAEWGPLPGGSGRGITKMLVWPDGELFAGGEIGYGLGDVWLGGIGRWDRERWHAIGDGYTHGVGEIAASRRGELFASGFFSTASGSAGGIARRDGSEWTALGGSVYGSIYAMAVHPNGDVIVGGDFTSIGDEPLNSIARWDGRAWNALGAGVLGARGPHVWPGVYSLAVLSNGDVVAGGRFETAGGVSVANIARWDGRQWHALAGGRPWPNPYVTALAVMPNGDLMAGGTFSRRVSRWNGTTWSNVGLSLSGGTTYPGQGVAALAVLPNGDLVAGGDIYEVGFATPVNAIVRWDGTSWQALGEGLQQNSSVGLVTTLAVLPNGDLVAGGHFNTAGGSEVRCIARWDGVDWHPLDEGIDGGVNALAILPGAEVVVSGGFLHAGGRVSAHLARWRPETCAADVTCDTVVTSGDFFAFVRLFFAADPGADFDGDGEVTSADFFSFLVAFFAGCP